MENAEVEPAKPSMCEQQEALRAAQRQGKILHVTGKTYTTHDGFQLAAERIR